MMGKILVTSSILDDHHANIVHWPLLCVKHVSDVEIDASIYDIVVITSRHAVLALKAIRHPIQAVFLVVGQRTADILYQKFAIDARIYANIDSLLSALRGNGGKSIAYLRGDIIMQELYPLLASHYHLKEILAYTTSPCIAVPEHIAHMLVNGQIGCIKIYSLRGYDIFKHLTKDLNYSAILDFIPRGLQEKVLAQR